jgi:hypothetical protein
VGGHSAIGDPGGSKWHRWDPHVHTPETILNDQYGGKDGWDAFLTRVEKSDPPVRALGITDYYSLDAYESVLKYKQSGRLSTVDLIFGNVEMRYGIGTTKGSPVNVHLLVSPEDPEHVDLVRRFLRRLTFSAFSDSFCCDRDDLIRLGRAHSGPALDERAALAAGTNQFKVSFDELRDEWEKSEWIQQNLLVAVAAGGKDGTSGLQEASLASLRKEIERFSHIIFSANSKQREFWLGRGAVDLAKLNADWGGRKPVLHGSDAHAPDDVGAPDLGRYSWIKGDLLFESLRQACLEPEERALVGSAPPPGALSSQTMASVEVSSAPWLQTPLVSLNAGLVGIIGARGSGKTALVDVIAAGGLALSPEHLSERSFVRRARDLLGESTAEVAWADGTTTARRLSDDDLDYVFDTPRVQYLSQQFVDRLCSSEGVTDELLAEIERVVFHAHPSEERMGTSSFRELLELRASHGRSVRQQHEDALAGIARELNVELDKRASLPGLQKQRGSKATSIANDKAMRRSLIGKGSESHAVELEAVASAAEMVRAKVDQITRRRQALRTLTDEVTRTRTDKTMRLRRLEEAYPEVNLSSDEWAAFQMDYAGDVEGILAKAIEESDQLIRAVSGPAAGEVVRTVGAKPAATSLIPKGARLETQTLSLLDKEIGRLRDLVGLDSANTKTLARLTSKISIDEAALIGLDREIASAQKADSRISELRERRRESYAAVFDGIVAEEDELALLYSPLKERLEAEEGALGKLSFSVRRTVDLTSWANAGEELLDLRTAGPFRGHGSLIESAGPILASAWESGTSADVAEAMSKFRELYESGIPEHSPFDRKDADAYRNWTARVSAWLYSTDHIKVSYGVQYEGVEIESLSPGTRGIVLLLLYLAIDHDDDRPLIIDQPEENLDPQSIYQELVTRFRRAKSRRQIVIVTHNANLIVNADADQVIVARCGPHRPGELPDITYESGGLENAEIRRQVCEILEGGEDAFKDRARRLRVRV